MGKEIKIRLQGGYYKDIANIELFNNDNNRVSLIYGLNGSGKSCISKAINEMKSLENENNTYSIVDFYDSMNKKIILNESDRSAINVFNEDFIENKVKLKDSLDAIIMLGEQGEYDSQITESQNKLKKTIEEINSIDLLKYENENTTHSISKKKENIIESLKNGWSIREKEIKNLSRNASVTETLYEEISNMLVPNNSKSQLLEEYSKLVILIKKARTNSEKISIDSFNEKYIDEDKILNILNEKIERPGSNDLEVKILETIEKKGTEFIENSKKEFSDNNINYCPYCFQKIDKEYKNSLLGSVKKVFNDKVDRHSKDIVNSMINHLEINLDSAKIIDIGLVEKCMLETKLCNEKIDNYNTQLEKKANNVFLPIKMISQNLNDSINIVALSYEEITKKINLFNKSIDELQNNVSNVQELNKCIAKLETKSLYNELEIIEIEYRKETTKLNNLSERRISLEKEILTLNSKKNSVDIALELINYYLALIFGDNRRLFLELSKSNDYFVKSKNEKVKLKNLSIGERNAIALCYFFSEMQKGTSPDSTFSEKFFIVLDDPISSFDFNNKIGIYSFLNMLFEKILLKNSESKILIFSHEIEVILNLHKVLCGIRKVNPLLQITNESKKNNMFCVKTINSDNTTSPLNLDYFNSYSKLLNDIYLYATSADYQNKFNYTIGNMMRKALEAFSVFQFNSNINGLNKDEILNLIINPAQKAYFKSRMINLVMNSESHTSDCVKNIVCRSTLEYFSYEEKIKAAKDVLAFIYLLFPKHIEFNFNNNSSIINNIQKWSEIPLNSQ
ncbi:MAG: AAA family ATPase [Bacilli bacterium]